MAGEASLPVFSIGPDWSRDLLHRYSFRTDLTTAEDGTEQGRGTRNTPRVLQEYPWTAQGDDLRLLTNLSYGKGGGRFQVPVWTDGVALGASLASGSTSVPIDTTMRAFAEGFAVIRGDTALDVELVEVEAVAPGALTISATTRTWPAGSIVYPSRVAFMDPHAAEDFTGDTAYGVARFNYAQANPGTAAAPPTMYRGLPVVELPPTWSKDPGLEFARLLDTHDDDVGIPTQVDQAGIPLGTQVQSVRLVGREAIADYLALIYWLDGARRAAWLPTWRNDLRVTADLSAVTTTLVVAACGYTDHVNLAVNRRDIRITTRTGAVFHRRITACAKVGATELLTLDSALGVAVAAAEIAQVCFLQVARSDSDTVEMAWWTGAQVDSVLTWRALHRADY